MASEYPDFVAWAKDFTEKGNKLTIRAVKAAMKCGQIKAEAFLRQYQDDKTRNTIEIAQVRELPEPVLNAISGFVNEQIVNVVKALKDQVQEAEARAAESAENLENSEGTATSAREELENARQEAVAQKARADILEVELKKVRELYEKVQQKAEDALAQAAGSAARLEEVRKQLEYFQRRGE